MNSYRKEYINILLHRQKRKRKEIKEVIGINNDSIVKEICDGRDIQISRLIKIADFFGVSCAEFFEYDGEVLQTEVQPRSMVGPTDSDSKLTQHIAESERKMRELECAIEKQQAEMKQLKELYVKCEKELAEMRINLPK